MKIIFVSNGSYERLVKEACNHPDTELTIVDSFIGCIESAASFDPNFVITTYLLPDSTGSKLASSLKLINPQIKIFMLLDVAPELPFDETLFSEIIHLPSNPLDLNRIIFSNPKNRRNI